MKHRGWKIAFGISWIPAGLLYWLGGEALVNRSQPVGMFAPTGPAFFLPVVPIILMASGQAVLGYLAFRR